MISVNREYVANICYHNYYLLFGASSLYASCVLHSSSRAANIVQSLLTNYNQQLKSPAQLHANQSHHGVLHGVTSAIACVYLVNIYLH